MDIGAFHCSEMAKSILTTVIGCWPSEWVYLCVYTLACIRYYGFSIELLPILFFVSQLDNSSTSNNSFSRSHLFAHDLNVKQFYLTYMRMIK